jgi:hypothetical protein
VEGAEENWKFTGSRDRGFQEEKTPVVTSRSAVWLKKGGAVVLMAVALVESVAITAFVGLSLVFYPVTKRPYTFFALWLQSSSFTVVWNKTAVERLSIRDVSGDSTYQEATQVFTSEHFARGWVHESYMRPGLDCRHIEFVAYAENSDGIYKSLRQFQLDQASRPARSEMFSATIMRLFSGENYYGASFDNPETVKALLQMDGSRSPIVEFVLMQMLLTKITAPSSRTRVDFLDRIPNPLDELRRIGDAFQLLQYSSHQMADSSEGLFKMGLDQVPLRLREDVKQIREMFQSSESFDRTPEVCSCFLPCFKSLQAFKEHQTHPLIAKILKPLVDKELQNPETSFIVGCMLARKDLLKKQMIETAVDDLLQTVKQEQYEQLLLGLAGLKQSKRTVETIQKLLPSLEHFVGGRRIGSNSQDYRLSVKDSLTLMVDGKSFFDHFVDRLCKELERKKKLPLPAAAERKQP